MGPIPPIAAGGAQPAALPSGAGRTNNDAAMSPTPGLRGASAAQIPDAVARMLQSIGGGLENDRMLRMLIGLMVLLAVLRQLDGQLDPMAGLNAGGPGGGANRAATTGLMLFSSTQVQYTSVNIQQTQVVQAYGGSGQAPVDSGTGAIDLPA